MASAYDYTSLVTALNIVDNGIPAMRLSTSIRFGEHRSVFRGQGHDFHRIREYDPELHQVNQILWQQNNISDDELYVRESRVPREVPVIIVTDLSSSVDFGVKELVKRKLLLETMGYLGLTATRDQDRVGYIGFTDKIIFDEELRLGKNNVYYSLQRILDFLNRTKSNERRKTDFFTALELISCRFSRGCFVAVISDFIDFEHSLKSQVFRDIASRHDLVMIFLDDPNEFANTGRFGFLRMSNIETEETLEIPVSKLKELKCDIEKKRLKMIDELMDLNVDSIVLSYGKHFEDLKKFFLTRRAKG